MGPLIFILILIFFYFFPSYEWSVESQVGNLRSVVETCPTDEPTSIFPYTLFWKGPPFKVSMSFKISFPLSLLKTVSRFLQTSGLYHFRYSDRSSGGYILDSLGLYTLCFSFIVPPTKLMWSSFYFFET